MRIRVRFLKLFRSSRLNPLRRNSPCSRIRLYGFLKTDARFSAGAWGEKALEHIEHTAFPVFVGGTGLYLRAFFDGIVNIPPIPDDILTRLTEACRIEGSLVLYRKLKEIDPAYAARIHENDRQRIVRAFASMRPQGKPFHGAQPNAAPPGCGCRCV